MTVMAVNGDSGTGKIYFCQTIAKGFGTLKPEEILYLMRDRKKDQKVFNRMLGLEWLKKHIEPSYYYDYPHQEDGDRPDEFFRKFLKQSSDKKLIMSGGRESEEYRILGGHGGEAWDCLTMGPKIISCGLDDRDRHSFKVWGTEFYVRMELSKLSLYP